MPNEELIKEKTEDWEKEFEELFEDCKTYGFPITTKTRLKSFCRVFLSQEKQKWEKKLRDSGEVGELSGFPLENYCEKELESQNQDLLKKIEGKKEKIEDADYYLGYNQALEDIKKFLK